MRAPKAVLFDLDGTLADTAPDIAHALNIALREAGLPVFSLDQVKVMVGGGARQLVERTLAAAGRPGDRMFEERIYCRFGAAYGAEPAVRSRLHPGATELLASLDAKAVKKAVVTNKPDGLTRRILEDLGISRHFGSIVGSRPDLALKPAPDMIHAALAELQISPADALFIGDSKPDVGAARAAGLPIFLLRHGYGTEPADTLGADLVLDDLAGVMFALGLSAAA